MNICFLSSMHPSQDKRVFQKEALSLRQAGFTVTHICPGKPAESGCHAGIHIRTYPQPIGIRGRLKQLLALYRLACQENADIYHCNEVDSWCVGVVLRWLRKKRCVFDVHEHYPSTFAQSRFPRWLQSLVAQSVRLLFRVLTPFTERIVLAKRSVAIDFPTADPEKIVLVRNYTPIAALRCADQPTRTADDTTIRLVHLGLFGRQRGWPQILAAMTMMRHQHLHLEVIGEINDGSQADFENYIAAKGLEKRVHLYDWMPFEQAFSHLLQAHIGLIAFQPGIQNHVYAMPHKLFDYMAAGLAVAMPPFAVEVAPIVEKSACGIFIDPADPADIARKLDNLLDTPATLLSMGQRGQNAVKTTYNWENEAKRLVSMYQELEKLA
jgi:glycosyltransferase involved in cell wall biosynthesis